MTSLAARGLGADRRTVLQALAFFVGAAALPDLASALVKGGGLGLEVLHPVFTPAERRLVAALSERIMPTTDTPGAIAAGVPAFIEMMLGDWMDPMQRRQFMADFRAVETFSVARYKLSFAKLTAARQDAIITLAMNRQLPGAADDFFDRIRLLVITGYHRSEPGATIERAYLPVPGDYIGDYPYAKVGRIFSS